MADKENGRRPNVPGSQILELTGRIGFMWTLKRGQHDDLDGAAVRILPDDDIEG
jgi:cbb3-type cytochrome oxidase maturation protein